MASGLLQLLSIRMPCFELTSHSRARRLAIRLTTTARSHRNSSYQLLNRGLTWSSVTCSSSSSPSDSSPSDSASPPPPQSSQPWRSHWRTLLGRLHASGHYSSDPQIGPEDIQTDPAAMKRAVLSFTRQRADILAHLSTEKIANAVRAGLPLGEESDRKARNAYRRLDASFVKGQPLPPGDGGPADLQDVLRMVLALASASQGESRNDIRTLELAAAAGELLPEVIAAMDVSPPEGSPQLSEKAKNIERMNKQKRNSGRGNASPDSKAPWARSSFRN